jgi:hypothetical protein
MGLNVSNIIKKENFVKLAIAGIAFGITYSLLKDQVSSAKAMAASMVFDTTTTAENSTVDGLKNKVLEKIYNGAMNPTVLIQNIEAVKTEVNTYTTQLTTLAAESTAGRIPASTIEYYCKAIAEEIATKLHIELRPQGYGGGYGGYDGSNGWPGQSGGYGSGGGKPWRKHGGQGGYGGQGSYGQYGENYDNYLDTIMQYFQQLMSGGYYQPNYGYSYGYGYQQPNQQPYYPTQNYNYYPQYPAAYSSPQQQGQGFAYIPGQQYQPGAYY